jgi:hypothetical protein
MEERDFRCLDLCPSQPSVSFVDGVFQSQLPQVRGVLLHGFHPKIQ